MRARVILVYRTTKLGLVLLSNAKIQNSCSGTFMAGRHQTKIDGPVQRMIVRDNIQIFKNYHSSVYEIWRVSKQYCIHKKVPYVILIFKFYNKYFYG